MIIVWQGYGWCVLPITIIFGVLGQQLGTAIGGPDYYRAHSWHVALAMFVAAGCIFGLSRWLAKRGARIVIDKQTGQEIALNRRHSFFFIPMHVWTWIVAGIGVLALIGEIVKRSNAS